MHARGTRSRLTILLTVLCLAAAGCENRQAGVTPIEYNGLTMGTTYSVKLVGIPAGLDPEVLRDDIESGLDSVNARMSTYMESSELSQFNSNDSTDWQAASAQLVKVLRHALTISVLSDGAFDVTVGPLVNLWGFGPPATGDAIPSEAAIRQALDKVGYRNLHVRDDPPAIRKDRGDLYVDLSAIAKGYAVDTVADYLDTLGVKNYLVEVGGEIRAKGHNASGVAWRIGIEQPDPRTRTVHTVINLHDVGVATSGDYRNYFENEGHRYSHAIDPRTGRPVMHELASVTVISPTAMHADGMATALMILGPDAGYRLAEREALAALFMVRVEDHFVDRSTPAFDRYQAGNKDHG